MDFKKKNTNEFILIFYFLLVKFENAFFLNITKRFFIRVWENIIIFLHRWGCRFVPAMVGWRDRTLPPRPHVPSCRPSDVALPDDRKLHPTADVRPRAEHRRPTFKKGCPCQVIPQAHRVLFFSLSWCKWFSRFRIFYKKITIISRKNSFAPSLRHTRTFTQGIRFWIRVQIKPDRYAMGSK